jgi:hypothetical protein
VLGSVTSSGTIAEASQNLTALAAEIRAAKAYAEGTPARVVVTSNRQLAVVKRLLALKLG